MKKTMGSGGKQIKSDVASSSGARSISSKAPGNATGRVSTGNGPYSVARVPVKMRSGKSRSGHIGE